MQYRNFGEIDWEPSALGFGMMRLPTVGDDYGNIDEEEAENMIKYAIDHGINYIDTAWPYHEGNSEDFVGRTLEKLGDDYREKVRLATKMPSWEIDSQEDLDEYFEKQLENLRTDHIDFYLLHALDRESWNNYLDVDVFEWIEKVKDEGKIDNIGFSFHDDLNIFKEIVDAYDWDFCQIQYNYLDQKFQAGTEGLKYAADQGLGVVIMEGLRGGQLAQTPPEPIEELWDETDIDRSPVEWALQWLWNQPEVSLVLSGMSKMEQVKENVEIADSSGVDKLSDKELETIEEVRKIYRDISPVNCTGCNYCMPCPNGVQIPRNFELYNKAEIYDNFEENKEEYYNMDEGARASACVACGQCEEACPQNLPIIDLLEETADYFGDSQ